MKIIQSDVIHECKAAMWHCTSCGEDWCMAETPKYCPFCGMKADEVIRKRKQEDRAMATTIVDLEVPEGKSIIHTLDKSGDTRLIWDRNNRDEVAAARGMFNDLRAKSFTAYKAEGKEGKKGEVIHTFDESAERIIMVPRMVGG